MKILQILIYVILQILIYVIGMVFNIIIFSKHGNAFIFILGLILTFTAVILMGWLYDKLHALTKKLSTKKFDILQNNNFGIKPPSLVDTILILKAVLKALGCEDQFNYNLRNYAAVGRTNISSLVRAVHSNYNYKDSYISVAFPFDLTDEGEAYWYGVDATFRNIYKRFAVNQQENPIPFGNALNKAMGGVDNTINDGGSTNYDSIW